ncbi:hypothetical protein N0V87_005937 [Didymella glomerata]|uniref:Uncharacterized protein n=1 Tax=Didymella glomerata TaxID=749621 RepID=A0A9W9BZA2_9PLEO|nr:hypothetical protein N0V87_005937 [Didymella glomerata]
MTVSEILAFLPNSMNSADVIYRMVSNGGTRKTIHAMINTFRNFEAEWSTNCCGETMYRTMHKAGFTDWTITKHDLWHDSQRSAWDANRLDVGKLRTVSVSGAAGNVSFRSLARNVRMMPEGDDALDLTGMVRYCVQNAEDGWMYPKDYEELLDLLGGPAKKGAAAHTQASAAACKCRNGQSPLLQRVTAREERATAKIAVEEEDMGSVASHSGTGFAGEDDPYSAYTFGGPRRTPPYRHLERIELPHAWDISGWAENLRWAFEQRMLFSRESPEALEWTESPEHMAHIERVRTQREWASDELLELLAEDD